MMAAIMSHCIRALETLTWSVGPDLTFLREMYSIDNLVDRQYLIHSIFPALKQVTKAPAILSVGVRPYTMRWEYLLKAQGASRFDTIELDATTAIYGSNHAHFQDIAQNIDKHVEANTYDVVIANGVLGWGIDSPTEISEFYFAQARVMKSKGYLILGYNPQVGSNHTAGIEQHFKKVTFGGLPQSTAFDVEWKHLYEFYQKIWNSALNLTGQAWLSLKTWSFL